MRHRCWYQTIVGKLRIAIERLRRILKLMVGLLLLKVLR